MTVGSYKIFRELQKYFNFVYVMTLVEIKNRYKRAILGFLWVVVAPLFQMIVIGVIFSVFIKIPNYFAFLYSGLLIWNFFSATVGRSTTAIIEKRELLYKAKFAIEAIPVSILLSNFFQMFISVILFMFVAYYLGINTFPDLWLIIPGLVWVVVLTLGLSLLLSSLNVRFRDVGFFVNTFLLLLFYATPVIYNMSLVGPDLKVLFRFNPLTSILELFRISLVGQGYLDTNTLLWNLSVSGCVFVLGLLVFARLKRNFVDWI